MDSSTQMMDSSSPAMDSTMQVWSQMPMMHSSQYLQNPTTQQMPMMHSSQYLQHPTTQQMPCIGGPECPSHSIEMPVYSSQHVQHSSTSASQNESGASSTIISFVPDVEEELIPIVGMLVDSIEEACNLYNIYAKAARFSVRKSSDARRKNEVVWKKFVCFKEGQKVEKMCHTNVVQRRVTDTRENCGVELQVRRNADGQWVVCKFVIGHSHILSSPRKAHMLRSHRSVIEPKKILIDSLSAANIRTCSQMDIFEVQAGGRADMVGFT
eukprot:TRINITY_DN3957_c1_g1_i5.p1 TRINITY_DN3957_c1_g1~~TRINITY_DN3957_c1_g1_i5.p1  ORF type:complete len:268 (+),score=38.22 TRINITY_DN3957_c1_g1_i5:522-1325(+)